MRYLIVVVILAVISTSASAGYSYSGGSRSSSFGSYRSFSSPSRSTFTPAPYRAAPAPAKPPVYKAFTPVAQPAKPAAVAKPSISPAVKKAAVVGGGVGAVAAGHAMAKPTAPASRSAHSFYGYSKSYPAQHFTASSPSFFSTSNVWFWLWILNSHNEPERVKASCDDPQYKDFKECLKAS